LAALACVPPGNSTPTDSGPPSSSASPAPTFRPSLNVMTAAFSDNFDRSAPPLALVALDSGASPSSSASASTPPLALGDAHADGPSEASATAPATAALDAAPAVPVDDSGLGSDWLVTNPALHAWRIESGKLCAQNAKNHGIWLKKVLPVNARIEFDAISYSDDGDLKAEVWGDGISAATSTSYTNATSYLAILGGWKNQYHVLARINEHGNDRKEIKVDPTTDDPKEKAVVKGQLYHFKVERTDGHTVKFSVNDVEYLTYNDPQPLAGMGHDHFGFNEWAVKVCFDNLKITPL
jgi:hypothetical protein